MGTHVRRKIIQCVEEGKDFDWPRYVTQDKYSELLTSYVDMKFGCKEIKDLISRRLGDIFFNMETGGNESWKLWTLPDNLSPESFSDWGKTQKKITYLGRTKTSNRIDRSMTS